MKKPYYKLHRTVSAIDPVSLPAVLSSFGGAVFSLVGFESGSGFVSFTGGTTPQVTLQPLELVNLPDGTKRFIKNGSPISGLQDGDPFSFPAAGGGLWLLQVVALSGAPTSLELFVAGGTRANEGSI